MANKNRKELIHVHSNVYTNGAPKSPSQGVLNKGELAINYNATEPALFIEDENGSIIKFNAVQRSEINQLTADITTLSSNKEDKSNKVTSISSASTDNQYPTAKCVNDVIEENELVTSEALNHLNTVKVALDTQITSNGVTLTLQQWIDRISAITLEV